MARQRNLNNTGAIQNALYPDPIYNNQLQEDSFSDLSYQDMGGVHPPRTHSGLQSIMPHALSNWRGNMNQMENWAPRYQPGQPFPHQGFEEMEFDETVQAPEKTGFNFPNIGITGILNSIKDQFQYKGAQGEAWDPNTGQMISAEDQDAQNALGGYYSDAARYARRQDKRVRDMLARKAAGKDIGDDNLKRLQGLGYGPEKVITETVTDVTRPGDGGGYTGPITQDFNPQQFARAGRRADRPGGFSDPGRGSYGPHKADGGRIGYAFAGPVGVEQQTDFIQGPQGGEEFQETVVEGQGQPSREQLEALAMEIFQLPLEELDEQQLVVVYQEAMQGQPMEEAVQEEDVQFAARGGLASLL